MNWEYEGGFLRQFNDWERNFVTQMVCRAYRGLPDVYKNAPVEDKTPSENLTQMLARFDKEITERSAHDWISVELRVLLAKLTTQVDSDEMKEFCRFIAKREKIDPEFKQKLKEQSQKAYANKAMSTKPPSEKQIKWLEHYGKEVPPTMAEASRILDVCFGKSS